MTVTARRKSRLRRWYDEHADVAVYWYGWGLAIIGTIAIATGTALLVQSIHAGKIAKRSCERSIKFGPYLADAYERDFDPGPGVFRIMPLDAAKAYRASIPKSC